MIKGTSNLCFQKDSTT